MRTVRVIVSEFVAVIAAVVVPEFEVEEFGPVALVVSVVTVVSVAVVIVDLVAGRFEAVIVGRVVGRSEAEMVGRVAIVSLVVVAGVGSTLALGATLERTMAYLQTWAPGRMKVCHQKRKGYYRTHLLEQQSVLVLRM